MYRSLPQQGGHIGLEPCPRSWCVSYWRLTQSYAWDYGVTQPPGAGFCQTSWHRGRGASIYLHLCIETQRKSDTKHLMTSVTRLWSLFCSDFETRSVGMSRKTEFTSISSLCDNKNQWPAYLVLVIYSSKASPNPATSLFARSSAGVSIHAECIV